MQAQLECLEEEGEEGFGECDGEEERRSHVCMTTRSPKKGSANTSPSKMRFSSSKFEAGLPYR